MGKCVFEKLEMFLSPGGRLLCRLLKGPFVFNLGVIGLDYRTGGFKIHMGKCVFEKLENVLFDGMGWEGGWVGWTEDQMGPSIFFILCGYIEHV